MRPPARSPHHDAPRSDVVKHPRRFLLHPLRPLARAIIRLRCRVHLHGADQVPRRGGIILAANHIGVADGPMLAIFAPRPVHALTKIEMFRGRLGGFLRNSGQIPLDRYAVDPGAVRLCLRVLRDEGVVGIFPEGRRGPGDLSRFHRGAAYLAMISGAPVVPVTFLGTRAPGAGAGALPPRGGDVHIVFGTPYRVDAQPWPRTREQVAQQSLLLREHMLACIDDAVTRAGTALPGPLPPGEIPDDPDTGVVTRDAHRDEGAS